MLGACWRAHAEFRNSPTGSRRAPGLLPALENAPTCCADFSLQTGRPLSRRPPDMTLGARQGAVANIRSTSTRALALFVNRPAASGSTVVRERSGHAAFGFVRWSAT